MGLQQSGAELVLPKAWPLPHPGPTQETLGVPDSWFLAQLLPLVGAWCRLEADCHCTEKTKVREGRYLVQGHTACNCRWEGCRDLGKEYGFCCQAQLI